MDCIAHRGFAGVNAENTLPAVRDAASRADGVEVDVRRCGSGDLVVHHDETVDRTTDGTGPVADYDAPALGDLHVDGSPAGVPAVGAVLDAVPESVTLHVELKETGLADDLQSLVAEAESPPPVVVSSFADDALAEVETFPTAVVVTEAAGAIDRARRLDCDAIHPSVNACSRPLVVAAHDADLAVRPWTVVNPPTTDRLREMGAEAVITDFPACCPGRRGPR